MMVGIQQYPLDLSYPKTDRLARWLVMLVIVACCIGAIFIHDRFERRRSEVANVALATAEATVAALDREIEGEVARLQGISSSPLLQKADLREFYDQLQGAEKPSGSWLILARKAQQLINTKLPFDTDWFPPGQESADSYQRSMDLLAQGKPYVVRPLSWSPLIGEFVTGLAIRVTRASDAMYLLWIGIPRQTIASVIADVGRLRTGEMRLLATMQGNAVVAAGGLQFQPASLLPDELRRLIADSDARTGTAVIDGRASAVGIARSVRVPWAAAVLLPTDKVAVAEKQVLAGLLLVGLAALAAVALVTHRMRSKLHRVLARTRELLDEAGLVRREAENRYRAFWENTGEGMFIARRAASGDFVLQECNPAYLRLLAQARSGPIRALPWACAGSAPSPTIEEQLVACEHGRDCVRFDCVIHVGPARLHWDVILAPLQDPVTGVVVQLLGCVRDATRSRTLKQALRRFSGRILAVQDEERRRVARDLHDSTGQILLAASLGIARVKAACDQSEAALECLDEVGDLIGQAQAELRTQSYVLHPPLLDELGLVKALREYIVGFERRSSTPSTFEVAPELGDLDISREVGIALFRVAQEAIGNAWRHAGCTLLEVRLVQDEPGWASLIVSDDGRGLGRVTSPDAMSWPELGFTGVGIASMRERMSQIGGCLTLAPRVGGGLTVQASFMLPTAQQRTAVWLVQTPPV